MKRFFPRNFATNSLALAACCTSGLGVASACDENAPRGGQPIHAAPTPAPAIPSFSPCSTPESRTIIVRLQTLVVPVSEKVDDCRDELASARTVLNTKELDLAAAEQSMVRGMEKVVAIKDLLCQNRRQVLVGKHLFSRESVADALRQSIDGYKAEVTHMAKLSLAVSDQKKEVDRLIAKVQRWVQAEKELFVEVSRLQKEQKSYFEAAQAEANKNAAADAVRVAATIESMLDATTSLSDKPTTEKPTSTDEKAILAEVDAILGGRG